VAGHLAYVTLNKSALAVDWNDWSDAAAAGVSAGYHFTRHLSLQAGVLTTTRGDVYSEQRLSVPGASYPLLIYRRHRFQTTGASAGLAYQFFDNRWVHPFAGGGIEAARQRETIDSPDQGVPPRLPGVTVPPAGTTVNWLARPYLEAGAKFYVSENAFIRSDVRSAFDSHGVAAFTWRTGIGVDF
jgi:hypothetical protein